MAREEPDEGSAASLRSRALHGSAWTIGGFALARLIQLASNLILTRLLFPEAFGLMALVNAVVLGLGQLSDLGIAPSVVRSPRGDEPRFLDTAWTIQIVRGVLLWSIAALLAWPVARFFGQPELGSLLPVVGLVALIGGLQSPALAVLQRHLAVRRLVTLELASQLLAIPTMLLWALYHPSVWALVVGRLVDASFKAIASHRMSTWRPRPRWDRAASREILHFGKWIFVSTMLSFLSGQLDRFIFGKTIPLALLGVYTIGLTFAMIPSELVARLGNSVVFPSFSRKLESDRDLSATYRRVRTPVLALMGFLVAGLVASGPALVETLYDPRYADAGWILQILAVGGWFRALEIAPGFALLSLGAPRRLALGHAAKVLCIGCFVPAGFWMSGFPGAVWGLAASQIPLYAIVAWGAHRHGLRTVRGDLAATGWVALSALLGLGVAAAMAGEGAGSVARLLAGAGTASLAWLVAAYARLRREGHDLNGLLRFGAVSGPPDA